MMALAISGTNAILMMIAAYILYDQVSRNVGATLLKDYIMSLTLSVLGGLAMVGTFGMKLETYAMARTQAKSALKNNILNI